MMEGSRRAALETMMDLSNVVLMTEVGRVIVAQNFVAQADGSWQQGSRSKALLPMELTMTFPLT